jgi:serine/threonine-protein kinase HipA
MPEIAYVHMHDELAGILMRDSERYFFVYDPLYIERGGRALSMSLPLQREVYESKSLFPYFDGLVSEGWLRKIQSQYQRIDGNDHFRLLINNGLNLAGAIRIEPKS